MSSGLENVFNGPKPYDKETTEYCEKLLLGLLKDPVIMNKPLIKYNDSKKMAVIIDPRFDDIMEAVIRNFMYFMNPLGWNLLIISYEGYKNRIEEKFPNSFFLPISKNLIYFNEKQEPNITIDTYNSIMMDVNFWKAIPVEYITIFQKDCIMFRMFDEYNYCQNYDYSGPNYQYVIDYVENIDTKTKQPIVLHAAPLFHHGINGGFSLRKRSVMIECLEKLTWDKIYEYRKTFYDFLGRIGVPEEKEIYGLIKINNIELMSKNEDIFFSHACEILQKSMPSYQECLKLGIEGFYDENTCVYHGWNKNYHTFDRVKKLLQNSPLFAKYTTK